MVENLKKFTQRERGRIIYLAVIKNYLNELKLNESVENAVWKSDEGLKSNVLKLISVNEFSQAFMERREYSCALFARHRTRGYYTHSASQHKWIYSRAGEANGSDIRDK